MLSLRRLLSEATQTTIHQSQPLICGNVGLLRCVVWKQNTSSAAHFEGGTGRQGHGHHNACLTQYAPSQSRRHLSTTIISLSRQQHGESTESSNETQQVYTLSNAISLSRLLSAPGIAWLIASEQWQLSLAAVTLAGASDLLDGYVAKTFNQQSVLGSYLDPLADKAVLCACFGALGWNATLSPKLVTVVLSRDALLVLAHFYHRATVLKWQASSIRQFFQTTGVDGSPAAERVQPLLVGKISTFVQFALVGACILSGALEMPASNEYTDFLVLNTYMWTIGSGISYLLACSWIKGSDKALMLVSGASACFAYHAWLT